MTGLLREGIREGITHHNASMFKLRGQLESFENTPVEDSGFYKQFARMPEILGIDQQQPEVQAIQNEAKASCIKVYINYQAT